MTVSRAWNALLAAVQFLTRVPVPGGMQSPGADVGLLKDAVVFHPVVGAMLGLLTGTVAWLGLHLWPPLLAVAVALVVEALVTGGFHEDAVADCCDAFGGAWTRQDVLRIMKDSRVGSFGALGLVLAVGLRLFGLASIDAAVLIAASMAAGAIGRWSSLVLMVAVPPVPRREGLAKDVGEQIGDRRLIIGTLLMLPGIVWFACLDPLRCLLAVAAALILVLGWSLYVRRRLGGYTGDCLGAACYMGQIVVLLVAAAR